MHAIPCKYKEVGSAGLRITSLQSAENKGLISEHHCHAIKNPLNHYVSSVARGS